MANGEGQKKQKIAEATTDIDDSQPLNATTILALFRMAIREGGVARKDDVTKVEKQINDVKKDCDEQLLSVNKRLDMAVGALSEQVARLDAKIHDGSKSGPGSVASTSGSSTMWAGRPCESYKEKGESSWVPRTIFVVRHIGRSLEKRFSTSTMRSGEQWGP